MEALLSFPSPPSSSSQTLTLTLTLTRNPLLARVPAATRTRTQTRTRTRTLTVRSAISRSKKEATVEAVKANLENCFLVAGIRYKGLTVKQLQDLRRCLPETTKLVVAKNTLVCKAVEGTEWEALKPCMTGMNAWLFVHSDEIPAAIKPYRDFHRERKLDDNGFSGAVFEGRFYAPDELNQLESLPTRAELYARVLGSIQSPAGALVGTIQAPARDLVLLLNAYVAKLEEDAK